MQDRECKNRDKPHTTHIFIYTMTLIYFLIIFILFDIILVAYVIRKRKKKKLSKKDLNLIHFQWEKISKDLENNPKHAILDADKLLDFVLSKRGYTGNLGEKLRKAQNLFNNLDDIWFAHKTRNRIAHEIDFQINKNATQRIIGHFKKGLSDLGIKL